MASSNRGGRTIYRDEEGDDNRRSYTTIKRYQVPENIARTVFQGDEQVEKKIVIRRERRASTPETEYRVTERVRDPSPRGETDWRFTERVIERDPAPRRDVTYRVVKRETDCDERSVVRVPSPPSPERERVREFRFERERTCSPPRERPFDVEKYSKSTEYFAQPQPIIIREPAPAAPIIIREERREPQKIIIRREEPQYEFVERKEVAECRDESRSLVKSSVSKKEDSPPPTPAAPEPARPEEDYFYERRVIERRRRSESVDRKTEIRPRDSASQYSSDGSYEYIRRTTYEDGDRSRSRSSSRSRSRRRTLAGGALAGVAAAEVVRHHNKRNGAQPTHRGRNAIGGAALGAAGAEGIARLRRSKSVRSVFGRGSRSRSRSGDRDRGRDRYDERDDRTVAVIRDADDRRELGVVRKRDESRRRRHRSRTSSRSRSTERYSRAQKLGGLAAVAAVAAVAGYALKNRGNKETVIVNDAPPHRSRSRRRRHSYDDTEIIRPESQARDPEHRNRRIAQAGLASAAAAGLVETVRSRSRARSKSRIRQGVPIAAAGLGGAALAGLYEKNKANKEAQKDAIIEDELHRGRRRHSRSRSRAHGYDDSSYDARSYDDRSRGGGPGMIAYGNDPIYPDARRGEYYSDEEPGRYRRRGGSRSSSPDTRRGNSRSRKFATAAAGAGAAGAVGVAAHEYGRRRERSRVAQENRRRDDDYYGNGREQEELYSPPPSMGGNGYQQPPYGGQSNYPSSHYFPPPPTGGDNPRIDGYGGGPPNSYPAYNPADYAGQPAQQHPYDAPYGGYGDSEANLGQPHPGDTYAGDERHNVPADHPQPDGRRGRSPENVSLSRRSSTGRESQDGDGLRTPRQRSSSRVRFDLRSNTAHSPDASRRKDDAKRGDPDADRHSDTETTDDRKHRRRKRKGKEREREKEVHYQASRERSPSQDSDGTIELPDRFDENGNRKPEDPLAHSINQLINGQGGAGGLFAALLGGGHGAGGDEDDDEGRTHRRRSRR